MNLTKRQLFLLTEIISKTKKDELTGKYTIYPKDYLFYNLNKRTFQMLERLCKSKNIQIEKLPERLKEKETEQLFKEYHQLKEDLEKINEEKEKQFIENKIIKIKQQIVLGHIEVMYRLINKHFPNLIKEQDSEDVYQTGYELLTWSIDKYDINKNIKFIEFLKVILIHRLAEKIWVEKMNLKYHEARDLISMMPNKDFLYEDELNIEEMKKINETTTNYLLLKSTNEYEVSIETLPEEYLIGSSNPEDDILDKIEKEDILILIETLPKVQQQILKLYYGFIDGNKHSNEEIAKIMGFNNGERVRQIKENALSTLSLEIYRNIYNSYEENSPLLEERLSSTNKVYAKKRKDELEDTIINSLDKEYLVTLLEDLPSIYKEIFKLYYGLKNGKNYSIPEISHLLNKKEEIIKERKRVAIEHIAKKLNNTKNKNHKEELVKRYIRIKKNEKRWNNQ